MSSVSLSQEDGLGPAQLCAVIHSLRVDGAQLYGLPSHRQYLTAECLNGSVVSSE